MSARPRLVAFPGMEVSEDTVALARWLLQEAEAGRCRGLAVAASLDGMKYATSITGVLRLPDMETHVTGMVLKLFKKIEDLHQS